MDIKIINYEDFTMNDIRMSHANWDKVKKHTNEEVLGIHLATMNWPQGYPDCLKDMPIEKQIEHFVVRESSEYNSSSYGEIDKEVFTSGSFIPLKAYKRFKGVIVRQGAVIGAIITNYYNNWAHIYPGHPACIYWSIDTDGTGSSSSDEYVELHCMPINRE